VCVVLFYAPVFLVDTQSLKKIVYMNEYSDQLRWATALQLLETACKSYAERAGLSVTPAPT